MKSTINQLVTMAAMLRGFTKTEPEAPRLFREYLEMVPATEVDALISAHESALAEATTDFEKQKGELETAESKCEDLESHLEKETERLDTIILGLQNDLETAKSERSDSAPAAPATAGDAGMITALQTSLFVERARVKQLEALVAAHSAVKPLDAKPERRERDAKAKKGKTEVPYATDPPVLSRNELRNGIELRFNGKPSDATREALTANKWRWSPVQPGQPWYAKYTEEQYLFAQSLATGSAYTPMPATPEPEAATPAPAPPIHFPTLPQAAATPTPGRRRIIIPDF